MNVVNLKSVILARARIQIAALFSTLDAGLRRRDGKLLQ